MGCAEGRSPFAGTLRVPLRYNFFPFLARKRVKESSRRVGIQHPARRAILVRSKESLESEYRMLTPKSRAQWERGKPVMPGGMIKGAYWRPPYPAYVERAEGCHLWDLDGRKYVDFENHHTSMMLGHSHPAVVEAVEKALHSGIGFGAPTTLEAEIAEEITRRMPSIEKVRFTNSGTESSLHATRLARAVTGKPKVAKFEGAYHGSHDALEISVSPPIDGAGPEESPNPVPAWRGMAQSSAEDAVILPYNQPESVELILREHRDELAAVFYDAKPAMFGTPPDFTRFVREITEELGLLLVMDEVVSFRFGWGGYQVLVGVEPDLTIYGKVIGGGFPVGAIGGRADLMDVLDNTGGPTGLYHSGTYSGNHFTLAAGLASLRALTPEVYEHLEALGGRLERGLNRVFRRAGQPAQVVRQGSLVNFYLTDRPVTDYRSAARHDRELNNRLELALVLEGYFARRSALGLAVSAVMGTEHIDGYLEAMERVLQAEE